MILIIADGHLTELLWSSPIHSQLCKCLKVCSLNWSWGRPLVLLWSWKSCDCGVGWMLQITVHKKEFFNGLVLLFCIWVCFWANSNTLCSYLNELWLLVGQCYPPIHQVLPSLYYNNCQVYAASHVITTAIWRGTDHLCPSMWYTTLPGRQLTNVHQLQALKHSTFIRTTPTKTTFMNPRITCCDLLLN